VGIFKDFQVPQHLVVEEKHPEFCYHDPAMRSFPVYLLFIILIFGPTPVGANGGPYFFDKILKRAEGGWLGYRVLVLDVTSFSVADPAIGRKDIYELTYEWDEVLENNLKDATFIPLSNPGSYGYHDLGTYQRVKPDEVRLPDATMERYIWFKQDDLNRDAALVFVPLSEGAKPLGKPSIMNLDMSLDHLDFLKGVRLDGNNHFQLGDTDARFRFAVDREPDGIPDLVAFDATEGYTRTYLLGRTPKGWVILWVGFPM